MAKGKKKKIACWLKNRHKMRRIYQGHHKFYILKEILLSRSIFGRKPCFWETVIINYYILRLVFWRGNLTSSSYFCWRRCTFLQLFLYFSRLQGKHDILHLIHVFVIFVCCDLPSFLCQTQKLSASQILLSYSKPPGRRSQCCMLQFFLLSWHTDTCTKHKWSSWHSGIQKHINTMSDLLKAYAHIGVGSLFGL